jgi:hypothetical protein
MTVTVSQMEVLKFGVLGLVALALATLVLPTPTKAATLPYVPQTQLELISYMQGVVDTLRAQVAAGAGATGSGSSRVQTLPAEVAVSTNVQLKASFDAGNSTSVYAWFEYGEGNSFDKKTARIRLTKVRGEVSHEVTLSGLKSGVQYSYRPVFELSGGSKYYGSVQTFGSGITSGEIISGGSGTTVSNNRGSLTLSKTTFKAYDQVTVSFTIPSARTNNLAWIGLFEVGASNSKPINWNYTGNNTTGELTFKIKKPGTYEFRLFHDRSGSAIVTSRRITVE